MPETSHEEDHSVESNPPPSGGSLPGERAIAPESQRVYVDAAVNFRAEGGRAATGFVKDLSMTGMFVATDTLYLSGTEIEFSMRVGEILLEGTGRVVWQRAAPSSRGLPIGIGVSFDRLDPDSRANIRELVGGTEQAEPHKLEELREAVSAGLDANRDWRPATERDGLKTSVYRAQRNRRDRRGWGVPIVSALIIAVLFLFGMGLQNRIDLASNSAPGPRSAATVTDESPTQAATPAALQAEEEPGVESEPEEGAEASPSLAIESSREPETSAAPAAQTANETNETAPQQVAGQGLDAAEVEVAVREWAAAWAAQDVDRYVGSYVENYAPSTTTHESWRAQRRSRLEAPDIIEVEIEELTVEAEGTGARATFVQRYRSDQYRDVVRKTLRLEEESGSWKIRSESSSPL